MIYPTPDQRNIGEAVPKFLTIGADHFIGADHSALDSVTTRAVAPNVASN
jgi:hypothetical protein